MRRRSVPSSVFWLAVLVALALAAAVLAGAVLYLQSKQAARVQAEASTGGDSTRGRIAIARYGCGSCHVIPGIDGATGTVGPNLTHVGRRAELAGTLANDPQSMTRWLMHPQAVAPNSGMPEMGVTQTDAGDMAAYLYAQN